MKRNRYRWKIESSFPKADGSKNLRKMLVKAIDGLKRVRTMLKISLRGAGGRPDPTLQMGASGINSQMWHIASFLENHEGVVRASAIAMRRLKDLNLLVKKANILIATVNAGDIVWLPRCNGAFVP